jgi:3,4-dihydroxy 2-butanone 4-phosphate synthase/GTP cyclohydrolase II
MRQEGRGIGPGNKTRPIISRRSEWIRGGQLELGFPDDLRDYGIGAQILWTWDTTRSGS